MSNVGDEILKKVQYILKHEKNEYRLLLLRDELASYETLLDDSRQSNISVQFTEENLEAINEGYERSMNTENLIPHDKVMTNIWKKLEKYSGKV